MTMTDELLDYIASHIDAEPPHLQQLYHDTGTQLLYSHMCSGHLQGRLLKMLVRMMRPRRVLELGTYSGYAAQCLAEGLADDDCMVDTIEANDEMEQFIVDHLAQSPVRQRINLHIADALQWMRHYDGPPYDLVFIDADKRQYVDYYELSLAQIGRASCRERVLGCV